MADYTVSTNDGHVAAHATLAAGETATVTFDIDLQVVEIITRDGGAEVWYTLDHSEPTPGGPTCYVIPAGVIGSDERQPATAGPTVVKLRADGSARVSVQRVA